MTTKAKHTLPTCAELNLAFEDFKQKLAGGEPLPRARGSYDELLNRCEKFDSRVYGPNLKSALTEHWTHLSSQTENPVFQNTLSKLQRIVSQILKPEPTKTQDAETQTEKTPEASPSHPAPSKVRKGPVGSYELHREETFVKKEDIIERSERFLGMANETGNDCFLIACLQFLKTGFLKENITKRLPSKLYALIACENPSSSAIRNYLVNHPMFKQKFRNTNLNIQRGQLDAQETFNAIVEMTTAQEDRPEPLAALKELIDHDPCNESLKNLKRKFHNTDSFLAKFFYGCLLPPTKFLVTLYNLITSIFSDDEEDDEIVEVPLTSVPLEPQPPRNPAATNPIHFNLLSSVKWDVSHLPPQVQKDDKFGGATNSSKKLDPSGALDLPLTMDADLKLEDLLNQYFSTEKEVDPSTLVVPGSEDTPEQTYRASSEKTIQLERHPSQLCIMIKRTQFDKDSLSAYKNLHPTLQPETFTLKKETSAAADACASTYDLKTFVVQLGESPNGGHYISCRKEADGWYYFNDKTANKITESAAFRIAKHASMAFYEKRS